MANTYHNAKLDKAVEDFDLSELNEEDITREAFKNRDGVRVFSLSVLSTDYTYSGENAKHNRNSDYYKLLNQINRALAKKEKEAQPA